MKAPFTKVSEAEYVGGLTPEGVSTLYTIKFTQKFPAPSFKEKNTTLLIHELRTSSNVTAPDAPSFKTIIKCEVK